MARSDQPTAHSIANDLADEVPQSVEEIERKAEILLEYGVTPQKVRVTIKRDTVTCDACAGTHWASNVTGSECPDCGGNLL